MEKSKTQKIFDTEYKKILKEKDPVTQMRLLTLLTTISRKIRLLELERDKEKAK
jgi:hypothetical protein